MQKLLSQHPLRFALFTVILSCSAYAYYYLYAHQSIPLEQSATQELLKEQGLNDFHNSKTAPNDEQPAEEDPMILPDIQLLQDIIQRGRERIPVLRIF